MERLDLNVDSSDLLEHIKKYTSDISENDPDSKLSQALRNPELSIEIFENYKTHLSCVTNFITSKPFLKNGNLFPDFMLRINNFLIKYSNKKISFNKNLVIPLEIQQLNSQIKPNDFTFTLFYKQFLAFQKKTEVGFERLYKYVDKTCTRNFHDLHFMHLVEEEQLQYFIHGLFDKQKIKQFFLQGSMKKMIAVKDKLQNRKKIEDTPKCRVINDIHRCSYSQNTFEELIAACEILSKYTEQTKVCTKVSKVHEKTRVCKFEFRVIEINNCFEGLDRLGGDYADIKVILELKHQVDKQEFNTTYVEIQLNLDILVSWKTMDHVFYGLNRTKEHIFNEYQIQQQIEIKKSQTRLISELIGLVLMALYTLSIIQYNSALLNATYKFSICDQDNKADNSILFTTDSCYASYIKAQEFEECEYTPQNMDYIDSHQIETVKPGCKCAYNTCSIGQACLKKEDLSYTCSDSCLIDKSKNLGFDWELVESEDSEQNNAMIGAMNSALISVGSELYAFGGNNLTAQISLIIKSDDVGETWMQLKGVGDLDYVFGGERTGAGFGQLEGQFQVVGGWQGNNIATFDQLSLVQNCQRTKDFDNWELVNQYPEDTFRAKQQSNFTFPDDSVQQIPKMSISNNGTFIQQNGTNTYVSKDKCKGWTKINRNTIESAFAVDNNNILYELKLNGEVQSSVDYETFELVSTIPLNDISIDKADSVFLYWSENKLIALINTKLVLNLVDYSKYDIFSSTNISDWNHTPVKDTNIAQYRYFPSSTIQGKYILFGLGETIIGETQNVLADIVKINIETGIVNENLEIPFDKSSGVTLLEFNNEEKGQILYGQFYGIWKTQNKGKYWSKISDQSCWNMTMNSQNTIFCCGPQAKGFKCHRSQDQGQTWEQQNVLDKQLTFVYSINDVLISFGDKNNMDSPYVQISTDQGDNWTSHQIDHNKLKPTGQLQPTVVVMGDRIIVHGGYSETTKKFGDLIFSDDYGLTWNKIEQDPFHSLPGLLSHNMVTDGYILVVMGGRGLLNENNNREWSLNPQTQISRDKGMTWLKTKNSEESMRYAFGAMMSKDGKEIIIAGGIQNKDYLKTTQTTTSEC